MITTISSSEHLVNSFLEKVYVGNCKDEFNVVELSHSVIGVCEMFGSFIKFVVSVPSSLDNLSSMSKRPRLNHDEESNVKTLPPSISSERNRKDALYNAIIRFLSEHSLGWQEPERFGKKFIKDLCNVLWYIDGHHDVFSSRSCAIPQYFSLVFVGFNMPHLSKHRKRSISNMSRDKLLEFSFILQEHAMSSWIQQPQWGAFKEALLGLIEAISSYASYLDVRRKVMKELHASPEPAVNFCDASHVKLLPRSELVSPLLSEINQALSRSHTYQKINVNEFVPTDKRQKYLYIRELEKGLSQSVFFFTYSHGSNVGNYYFLWKAPEYISEEACSIENLRVVEAIKAEIPVFHSRMMRREFFDMYGRISPHSRPYVLRSIYHALTNDLSASRTTTEKEVDERIAEALMMEDPDIIIDLRETNLNGSDRYSVFGKNVHNS